MRAVGVHVGHEHQPAVSHFRARLWYKLAEIIAEISMEIRRDLYEYEWINSPRFIKEIAEIFDKWPR